MEGRRCVGPWPARETTRPGRGRRAAGRRRGCGVGRAGEGRAARAGDAYGKDHVMSLGEIAYEAYHAALTEYRRTHPDQCDAAGRWASFSPPLLAAWEAASQAVVDAARAQDHTASEGCRAAWPGDYGAQCLRVCLWFKLIHTERLAPLVNAPCAAPCTRQRCRVTPRCRQD